MRPTQLLVLLLFPLVGFAQIGVEMPILYTPPIVSGGGSVFNPTNGFGITAAFWYEPHTGAYGTNSGVPTLPNLTSLGHGYDLTNKAAQATWPTSGSANVLAFLFNPYLENTIYTSQCPAEVFVVCNETNQAATCFIFDSDNANAREAMFNLNPDENIFDGNTVTTEASVTYGHYMVHDIIFPTSGSKFEYTNGVQAASGTVTAQSAQGMVLGAHNSKIDPVNMGFLTFFVFTNVNLGAGAFSVSSRSNAYHYCTNLIATCGFSFP